jgi:peptidoglycan/LPS O-acetylase OafA/YrhL
VWGLDTLRSIAIVAVVVYHLLAYHGSVIPAWLAPAARTGWMGVDLFFVLSGFLIASQLLRPYATGGRPSLGGFYRNRLFRILPAYLAVLAVYFLVPGWTEDTTLSPLWQYLSFTVNLCADRSRYQGFSHAWSLCVEEHFYLLLPLTVLVLMRKPSARKAVAAVAAVALFGMAVRGYFLVHLLRPLAESDNGFGMAYMERIYYPTYSRLDGLLAGVTLAAIRSFRPVWWNWIVRRGHATLVLGLALTAASIALFEDRHPAYTGTSAGSVLFGYPLLALGLALVTASALSANGLLRWRIPGAGLCATLAYTLYLTHKALIHLVDAWFPQLAGAGRGAWLAVYALCCLLAAALLHLAVERPFLRWRERLR